MRRFGSLFGLFLFVSFVVYCKTYNTETNGVGPIDSDAKSQYKIALGRSLFYDPMLSRDTSISCAVCHKQDLAFTDGLPQSIGIKDRKGTRNAPTLTNVANRPYFMLDGVNPSLEAQITAPIQEHAEFDFHILLIVERLKSRPNYVRLARIGYDSEITNWVVFNSIAEFERTLISKDAPYDHFIKGDSSALTPSQKRGHDLFFNTLYCGKCHNGPDLTNNVLTNNGLYEKYQDSGRMRLTHHEADRAIFKVPTLRNITVTAPYMHNGRFESLEEVIAHYMAGGAKHPNKSELIVPFDLTKDQRTDLIHFFESLTDSVFLNNPAYSEIEY